MQYKLIIIYYITSMMTVVMKWPNFYRRIRNIFLRNIKNMVEL